MTLHTRIFIGLIAGGVAGGVANALWPDAPALTWVIQTVARPVGQIFLRLLFMLVVPLVFSSLALGVAGLGDVHRLGRIGARTLLFVLATTTVAAVLGVAVALVLRPGDFLDPATRESLLRAFAQQAAEQQAAAAQPFSVDMLVSIVPRNPLAAAARDDMLGVIFFTVLFGVALTRLPREVGAPLIGVLEALDRTIGVMVSFAMRFAPVGVAGLIFETTGQFGFGILRSLGAYVLVVLLGLALVQFGFLGLVVRVAGGVSPTLFFRRSWPAMVTAFATASSSATLPTTMRTAQERLGIPGQVAGFVIPLGATLHKTGTAFFSVVAILFLAQVFGVALDLRALAIVLVMSMLTAIAVGGIPFGAIPMLIGVLALVRVPPEGIALILGVDQLMGMARTVTNVVDDLAAALYVARAEGLPAVVPPE